MQSSAISFKYAHFLIRNGDYLILHFYRWPNISVKVGKRDKSKQSSIVLSLTKINDTDCCGSSPGTLASTNHFRRLQKKRRVWDGVLWYGIPKGNKDLWARDIRAPVGSWMSALAEYIFGTQTDRYLQAKYIMYANLMIIERHWNFSHL